MRGLVEGTEVVVGALPPPAADVCVLTRSCAGDWDSAWEIFEKHLPVDTPDMPDVMEILAFDNSAAESKAQRRQMEQDLKVGFGMERRRLLEI